MESMIEGGGGGVIAALFVHSEMRENGDERLDGGCGPKFSRSPFFRHAKIPCAKKIKKGGWTSNTLGGTDVCNK